MGTQVFPRTCVLSVRGNSGVSTHWAIHGGLGRLRPNCGMVMTACGPVEAVALGRVMMHEHLPSDLWDWDEDRLVTEERPISDRRRQYLLDNALPLLRECHGYGMHAFVDTTMPPWRAWPTFYRDISEAADCHIVLSTGFYREIEVGTYFVKRPEDAIWPFVQGSATTAGPPGGRWWRQSTRSSMPDWAIGWCWGWTPATALSPVRSRR